MKKSITTLSILLTAITIHAASNINITNITEYNGNFSTPSGNVVISGDNDVSTNGTLVEAFNFGSVGTGTTTVNGVVFTNVASPDGPGGIVGSNIFVAGNDQTAVTGLGSGSAPYSNLSTSYQSILNEGTARVPGNNTFFNLTNLSSGQEYEVQFWVNNSSLNSGAYNDTRIFFNGNADTTLTYVDGGVTVPPTNGSIQVSNNNIATAGGLGSYIIGRFTSDGTEQSIRFSGSAQINAAQLRAIPEPATVAAILGGLCLLLVGLKRMRIKNN